MCELWSVWINKVRKSKGMFIIEIDGANSNNRWIGLTFFIANSIEKLLHCSFLVDCAEENEIS